VSRELVWQRPGQAKVGLAWPECIGGDVGHDRLARDACQYSSVVISMRRALVPESTTTNCTICMGSFGKLQYILSVGIMVSCCHTSSA